MSRLYLAFFLLLGTFAASIGQNLVPNYSFETNSGCPGGPCEWQRATSWNNVNMLTGCGGYGTPDYFHTCGAGFSHLPYNGYLTVNPYTGNAVMGFLTWSGSLSPNFRELVSTQLTSPMVVGQNYSVSFWICNGFTPYYGGGSNHIGLDFSTGALTQGGGLSNVVSLVPEYEIPGVFFSHGWVNYTFNITATAAWRYITFGNFYNDAATTATLFYAPAPFFRCYYFIDDVVIQTAVVLPVRLGTPTVAATRRGSQVQWTAQNEEGIVQYQVERSRSADDGFELIGQTPETGKGDYSLPDNAIPAPGTWYYRVRANDASGQAAFSEVVAFEFSPNFPLISAIYPSPANAGLQSRLQLWLPQADLVNVQLLDVQGRVLATSSLSCESGENTWPLPTAELAQGTYLVRIGCGSGTASTKLMVAH
ncbi:MAG TPA: T9SS type A sorting domain-containing protein [Bacteroidia bacterium]|nr:T9SS type A sorting domain-containing protein [Bacteroidia bacterium]